MPPAGSDPKEIIKALDDFEADAVPLDPEMHIGMDPAVVQFSKFVMRTKGKWIRVPEKSDDLVYSSSSRLGQRVRRDKPA